MTDKEGGQKTGSFPKITSINGGGRYVLNVYSLKVVLSNMFPKILVLVVAC